MFFVWLFIAAFILGWGNNIGALSIDREGKDRIILGILQVVVIMIALAVFAIGI